MRASSRRGFTLLELMIGIGVSSIVLVAIAATVIAMNGVFQSNAATKSTVEDSRSSLAYLERVLPMAGYGVPPPEVWDFGTTGPVSVKDNDVQPTHVTDDLAFRYRDPSYLRRGTIDAAAGTVTFVNAATSLPDNVGINVKVGQVFMVACPAASGQFLVVKATATAVVADTALSVQVYGAPFPTVNDDCLRASSSAAYIMLIHEKRIRVLALGGRPYLVVLHNFVNLLDYDVLAADVENFQVSYVMNQPSPNVLPAPPVVDSGAAAPNWVFADQPGLTDLPNPGAPAPSYKDSYTLARITVPPEAFSRRFNAHPANIRAVRIGLTLKSQRPMPNKQKNAFPADSLGNYTSPVVIDEFYRISLSTQVNIPNMAARAMMTPPMATVVGDNNNKWGG